MPMAIALNAFDLKQNVANLLYLPRAPVFVPNPTNSSLPADFRFYLDLNRNGQFETNGLVSEINRQGNPTACDDFRKSVILNGSACWSGRTCRTGRTINLFRVTPLWRCPPTARWI